MHEAVRRMDLLGEQELDSSKISSFRRSLIALGREDRAGYPWRRARSPYNILVAELMLQRTGVAQVLNVYEDFVARFPDVNALNRARMRTLKRLLEPLGRTERYAYFAQTAQILTEGYNGEVPDSYEELLRLPGIGPYSARAILCFSFGKRVGLLDPNIYRVVSRVFSLQSDKDRPETDKSMWLFVDRLLPRRDCCMYNEALIDLGRTICVKHQPRHSDCALRRICGFEE